MFDEKCAELPGRPSFDEKCVRVPNSSDNIRTEYSAKPNIPTAAELRKNLKIFPQHRMYEFVEYCLECIQKVSSTQTNAQVTLLGFNNKSPNPDILCFPSKDELGDIFTEKGIKFTVTNLAIFFDWGK